MHPQKKSIMKKTPLLILLLISCLNLSHAQQPITEITGTWEGHIHITKKDSLALVISIEIQGDSVVAELDSPDQYAFGMTIEQYSYSHDTLKLKMGQLGASYQGVLNRESGEIEGTFTQNRKHFSLNLQKIAQRLVVNRPQTPQPPFDYDIKDEVITLEKGEKKALIRGTLTTPANQSPKALVILISGSGWQDRNETIFLHKPFWVIADYLTTNNYAVFRFDDLPMAQYNQTTTSDMADYMGLLVKYFAEKDEFKGIQIGLLGHSEGGLIACMSAAKYKEIDFAISMAGIAEHISEVLLYQVEKMVQHSGFSDEEVANTLLYSQELYTIIEKSKSKEKAIQAISNYFDYKALTMNDADKQRYGFTDEDIFAKKQQLSSVWMYNIFKINPLKHIRSMHCPLYALNGEKDTQVAAATNIPLMQKYKKKNELDKFEIFPNLNHLFQKADSGMVDEYGKIEQTISPVVLKKLGEWLDRVATAQSSSR